MIRAEWLYDRLAGAGIGFFTGVPDSVLKAFCSCLADRTTPAEHVVAANEGGAVALAAGYSLATGRNGLVYMQNSGLGNAVNPLLSLADREAYAIPALLLIGWRGRPDGGHDEPQHMKQGRVTTRLLDDMGVPWRYLGTEEAQADEAIGQIVDELRVNPGPCALLAANRSFAPYAAVHKTRPVRVMGMRREEAISLLIDAFPEAIFVGTTGMASRELFEIRRERKQGMDHSFMNVGSMGHVSQIAAAIAQNQPGRTVVCLDGDGSAIMHLGGMAVAATMDCPNFIHVVINNGVHDSVGGQKTARPFLDLSRVAETVGYRTAWRVVGADELKDALAFCRNSTGPVLLEIMVDKGARDDLGRPGDDLLEYKKAFTEFLHGG